MTDENHGATAVPAADNPAPARSPIEQRVFLAILALVSVLFFFVLLPFYSAIFWACALTVVAYPLHRRVQRLVRGPNLSALATLSILSALVLIPALFILFSFFREGAALYDRIQTGQFDAASYVERVRTAVPAVQSLLEKVGIDTAWLKQHLSGAAMTAGRFLAQNAVQIGKNAFGFFVSLVLMLYLSFFMLRDGPRMVDLLIRALPLGDDLERMMLSRFAEVTRATVKGSLVIAIVQGGLGGIIFWILGIQGALLWGVAMIAFSLIPIVGASLIWVPVAVYLFAIGAWVKGLVLVGFCAGVIGTADNILRPILVGRDTKLPDYLVLLSTLGGFAIFGMNGFIVGPLVAVLFIALWDVFVREFNPPQAPAPEAVVQSVTSPEATSSEHREEPGEKQV
jgi:predicted PurR-regulated permease PerM